MNMNNINKLNEVIDCEWYLNNMVSIDKYYKINKLAYRLFHSRKGFMHMSISFDNKYHSNGKYYQQKKVEEYISKDTKNILEIGCGQGADLLSLAKKHPNINFTGVDLNPSIDKKVSNVKLIKDDYHYLNTIPDNSQDIVYAFETMCVSTQRNQVFKQVSRVLKKNGIFIIYDGYITKEREKLTDEELKYLKLFETGSAVPEFEYYENIPKYAKKNGFKEVFVEELTENVKPNAKRFKNIVKFGMTFKHIFKLICKVLPKEFVGNAITGYLFEDILDNKLCCYYGHVYKKI